MSQSEAEIVKEEINFEATGILANYSWSNFILIKKIQEI